MTNQQGNETDDSTIDASNISNETAESTQISSTYKVLGEIKAPSGTGLLGHNMATSGAATGVEGVIDSPEVAAKGVYGKATASTGRTYAVHGDADSKDGIGVKGTSTDSNVTARHSDDTPTGVWGHTGRSGADGNVFTGHGIRGSASASSGRCVGVKGRTQSADGIGVAGANFASNGQSVGVKGKVISPDVATKGVYGKAIASTGRTYAVHGDTDSKDGIGVKGTSTDSNVTARHSDDTPTGVWGHTGRSGADGNVFTGHGVRGSASASSGLCVGVKGRTQSADGFGVKGVNFADDGIGVNADAPNGVGLTVTGADTGSNADPLGHAALIETNNNDSNNQILAVKTAYTDLPASSNNFVTFFNGNDNAFGSIEGDGSGGVTLNSGSADYAEYLPRLEPEEAIEPADVVGVVGGAVTKRTADANLALVVSDQPIVTGNAPGQNPDDRRTHEQVAFVGQVPVKVRGPVEEGDLLVPSGQEDGTARALDLGEWTPGAAPVVGRAWESTDLDGVSEVTVAVGFETGETLAPGAGRRRDRIAELEALNEARATRIDELEERVATLEAQVASTTVSADD